MGSRPTKTKWLLAIGAVIALVAALGCAQEEAAPTPTPAPTAVPAAAIAQMVKDAVTESVPKGTSAQEIRSMVEAAVAASAKPGVSKAEVEAAVKSAAAGQLTAAQVGKIVDESVKALPAPEVDVGQLRSLVQSSVAQAVPKGVSAAEISKMVEAAVAAATAGAVTRGDMETLIAQSVRDTAAGQLSAADVKAIVKASLAATDQAIAKTSAAVAEAAAAAQAAQAAAQEAVTEAKAATEAEAARQAAITERFVYMAPTLNPGEYPSHTWFGAVPTEFKEAPSSAALVREGKILPLEERLPVPEDILVVAPYDEIGVYGGVMRLTQSSMKTLDHIITTSMLNAAPNGMTEARVLKSFEVSEDGRTHTFKIRRGARWSDGYPFTMEDMRFTWEDMMGNAELNPSFPYDLISPISGNPAKFTVVDEGTWTLTYDDPNYVLPETRYVWGASKTRGCPRCWYGPAHVLKRFHPKYNPDEIPALIAQSEQPDWTRMFKKYAGIRDKVWVPSETVPTVYDPDYIYKGEPFAPAMGELLNVFKDDDERRAERNHYFFGVDPEGNQLPYMEGQVLYKMESRDAAIFRAMAGENDYYGGTDMRLSELALYLANAEKGDYSVYLWRSPGGTDQAILFNQEYVQDPEIGALMRTHDFRRALSFASDRLTINETLFSGVGIPQNWVVHSSWPYFPGQRWADYEVQYDLAQAKALMKQMGYEDKDGDGYLDRKDGTGPLELYFEERGYSFDTVELLQAQWKDLGIKLNIKEGSKAGSSTNKPNPTQYFDMNQSLYDMNPWAIYWTRQAALYSSSSLSPEVGQYYATFGKEGMAPIGPDPKYTDAYGNMAAEGNYPADLSGKLRRQQEIFNEGKGYTMFSPKRVAMGKEWFRISAEQKFNVGLIAYTGIMRGIQMKRNNVRNVPRNHVCVESGGIFGAFYFEDGIDNMNHPGNRSKKYQSISFLDPGYWTGQ